MTENEHQLASDLKYTQKAIDDAMTAIENLRDENEDLELRRSSLWNACSEWADKTDWARPFEAKELGKHLADVIKDRFDALNAENERLKRSRDMWRDQVEEQSKELTSFRKNSLMMAEAFKKDIDAFRKDAQRYQYLRRDLSRGGDSDFCIIRKYWKSPSLERILSLESADEEIDDAMDVGK